MIINATSHTIKKIWILFLFIVLFFVAFIATLMHGLFIESLRLPNVKIDQLYMKLDKKLIVNIQTLTIDKSTSADTSLEESALILENFPYLNQFLAISIFRRLFTTTKRFRFYTIRPFSVWRASI
ncbi:MAG: hypothetical protein LRY52_07460 [Sulfurospirillum cavolei]|nr:hypothetical protein [Sulfurospirillum cavolei]